MKQIKLLPQDFDTLTINARFETQYSSNVDCPIARALKRRFKTAEDVSVSPTQVELTFKNRKRLSFYNLSFRLQSIEKAAIRLQKTGKPVIIKL